MMKKLISSLANIPFVALAAQFPEAPMCFHALKTVITGLMTKPGHHAILAMDLKTHASCFDCCRPVIITKVGYQAWKSGILYRVFIWEVGKQRPLSTCLIKPERPGTMEFFNLKYPVQIEPGKSYYISRTYIEGGLNRDMRDYVGWLSKREDGCPQQQQLVTFRNGFFTDGTNPCISHDPADIATQSLLPVLDVAYTC